ncbi:MAG: hypothetical protein DMD84_12460, partial [Candidatus Rokuibacteriota bacterium]
MKRAGALVAILAVTLASAGPAVAHTGGSNGYASVAIDGARVRYSLTLWPAVLPPAVAEHLRLARAGNGSSRDRVIAFVRDKVTLVARGRRCEAGPGSLLPTTPDAASVTVVVEFGCGADIRDLLIRDDLFDVLGADYHTLARIDGPGLSAQFAFTPESRETRVTLGGAPGGGRGVASFALLGIEHILDGWDHLLFLLGLLLCGGGWLALAKIITAFTL